MKRKYLSRFDWKRILKRKDKKLYVKDEDFTGNIHFLKMLKVSDSLKSNKFKKVETVVDNNYTWMLFLPDNEFHVIIGQIDDKENLIQVYIDIIDDSGVENGEIYYDDIYLDVILNHDKKILLDDIDELEDALREDYITVQQYERAYKNSSRILKSVKANPDKWFNLVKKYYEIMK